jgi:hypothetical protein
MKPAASGVDHDGRGHGGRVQQGHGVFHRRRQVFLLVVLGKVVDVDPDARDRRHLGVQGALIGRLDLAAQSDPEVHVGRAEPLCLLGSKLGCFAPDGFFVLAL